MPAVQAGPVQLPGGATAREGVCALPEQPALADLDQQIVACRRCPRLVAWREDVAERKRAAFRHEDYWGAPIPGFGPADARIGILGLAPAAHGGNRTGRVFTGDRSGDVLFAALHRAGLANQPHSVARDDGLTLTDTRILAAVRCAPPANKPTPAERDACAPWLHRELRLLTNLRVVLVLGAFAWASALKTVQPVYAVRPPSPRPRFGHGARLELAGAPTLLGCYHVSQQNTFTGRLTPAMLDAIIDAAKRVASEG